MNILVVDDSETMRGLLRNAIESNISEISLTFFEAADGQKAFDIITENEINLILLDWNMPVLDGLTLVKKVRSSNNHTPIVMVSSIVSEDKILEALDSGVNVYLEKPLTGSELWEEISEFIDINTI